jgi:hypothetical protein
MMHSLLDAAATIEPYTHGLIVGYQGIVFKTEEYYNTIIQQKI